MHAEYEEKLAEAQEQVLVMQQQAQEELAADQAAGARRRRDKRSQTMRDKAQQRDLEEARQQAIYQHRRDLGQLVTDAERAADARGRRRAFQQASIEEFIEQLVAPACRASTGRPWTTDEAEVVHVQLVSAQRSGRESMDAYREPSCKTCASARSRCATRSIRP